jgi:hypothetical protein
VSEPAQPDVARLLQPFFAQIPAPARPLFLAMLERIAAERYRSWATLLPVHADDLLACADDENEVARRVEAVFTTDADTLAQLTTLGTVARDAYADLFAGRDLFDQLRIQANAERQGAQAWRAIGAAHPDSHTTAELETCALLEERSAGRLEALLD